MADDKRQSVGAIWIREAKSGKKFMSIQIGDKRYVGFKNTYKEQDKHPDYRIYENQEQAPRQEDALRAIPEDDIPF